MLSYKECKKESKRLGKIVAIARSEYNFLMIIFAECKAQKVKANRERILWLAEQDRQKAQGKRQMQAGRRISPLEGI